MEDMKELAEMLLNETDARGGNEVAEALEVVNELLREAEVANADEAFASYADIIAVVPWGINMYGTSRWWTYMQNEKKLINYLFGHALRLAANALDDFIGDSEGKACKIYEMMTAHEEYGCEYPQVLAQKVINARAASKGSYPLGMLLYCVGRDCLVGDADCDTAIEVEIELEKNDYFYASEMMVEILRAWLKGGYKPYGDHEEWLVHCGRYFADHGDWVKSIWAYKLIVDDMENALDDMATKAAVANKFSLMLQSAADEYSELAKNLALAL